MTKPLLYNSSISECVYIGCNTTPTTEVAILHGSRKKSIKIGQLLSCEDHLLEALGAANNVEMYLDI